MQTDQPTAWLTQIDSPADLRQLPEDALVPLAKELRDFLMQTLNHCGGHFGAGMGAVELSIALHYVFNTPDDQIIWDVGHQAYPHKILTGRRDALCTIRQDDGLSPFPKQSESPYDSFGVGHSSTSVGAAVGMAEAFKQLGSDQQAIAVIGDGAMTAGMVFEALNHAGDIDANVLVIVNDNEMSISPNVGALSDYFTRIISGKLYTSMREGSKKVLDIMPPVKALAKHTENQVKHLFAPGTIFADLGVDYYGPVNGHDLHSLLDTLRNMAKLKGPRLLHVITEKGKGYAPAEDDPVKYHAVKPGFLNLTAKSQPDTASQPTKTLTYSEVFGQWLCAMAARDEKLVAITPAMREGSGMVEFSKRFADRYYDVAIAEQHSVTFAAGLACHQMKPVVAIYSTFLQRAYDQLAHDVALQNLDVLFAIDRAGHVGGDGPTHGGSFDISFMRCIPNMVIMTPSDENECWHALSTGYAYQGPAAVRYPRGHGVGAEIERSMTPIEMGKAVVRREGQTTAILAFGSMLKPALEAAEKLNATVVDMRFVKPLDVECIVSLSRSHDLLVTVEEHSVKGGAGSAVNEALAEAHQCVHILNLGFPDVFAEHGSPANQLARWGLDAKGVEGSIREKLAACQQRSCVDNSEPPTTAR